VSTRPDAWRAPSSGKIGRRPVASEVRNDSQWRGDNKRGSPIRRVHDLSSPVVVAGLILSSSDRAGRRNLILGLILISSTNEIDSTAGSSIRAISLAVSRSVSSRRPSSMGDAHQSVVRLPSSQLAGDHIVPQTHCRWPPLAAAMHHIRRLG